MSKLGKVLGAVGSILDPRLWLHPLRLLHYYNHTHVTPRRRLTLGPGVVLAPNVSLANGERIEIGARSRIGARCHLWAGRSTGRIIIGSDSTLAPDCFLTASDYGLAAGAKILQQERRDADIRVGSDVWLGARVIVTAGVTIGDGCVIGAGSVVTRDIPPGSIAVGVPARVVRQRG